MGERRDWKLNQDSYGPYTTNRGRTGNDALLQTGAKPIVGWKPKKKRMLSSVVTWLFIAFLCLVTAISLSSAVSSHVDSNVAKKAADIAYRPQFTARYTDLGKQIVSSYYSGSNPPVNLAAAIRWPSVQEGATSGVTEDGSMAVSGTQVTDITLISASENDLVTPDAVQEGFAKNFPNPKEEILTYLATINSRQYTVSVTLVIPDLNDIHRLPYLISPPTIMEMPVLTKTNVQLDVPDDMGEYTKYEVPEPVQSTITQWADAYAQGDPDTLKRLTGDKTTNSYRGVGGFRLEGVPAVLWAYTLNDNPETAFVRIQFDMSQRAFNQNLSQGGMSSTFIAHQQMDLLLHLNGDIPNVVAWGPTGSWWYIYPKFNAYTNKTLVHSDLEDVQNSGNIPGTENTGQIVTDDGLTEEEIKEQIKNNPGGAPPTIDKDSARRSKRR